MLAVPIQCRKGNAELESRGYRMLLKNKKEGPDRQAFLGAGRLLVGITFTPWMRYEK
jgi:hypothetical protein